MSRHLLVKLAMIVSFAAEAGLAQSPVSAEKPDLIPPNDPRVAIMGRFELRNANTAERFRIGYPGVTLRLRFEGTSLAMRASTDTPDNIFAVILDGTQPRPVRFPTGETELPLAEALPPGEHTIDIVRQTETWLGVVTIVGFRLSLGAKLLTPAPWPRRRMMFIGDSVTCAEAMERTVPGTTDPAAWKRDRATSWNAYNSYSMRLARTFDAQVHLVCYGGRGLLRDWENHRNVLNAPQFFNLAVPDEPKPNDPKLDDPKAAANAPVWQHASYVPDVVVVSLGTNDFALEIPAFPLREEWVATYVRFVHTIRSAYPGAHVILTEGPLVNDHDPARPQKTVLNSYLQEIAARLADPRVQVFPSRHYPGDPTDAHPTAEQHEAMVRDLEPAIREAAGW